MEAERNESDKEGAPVAIKEVLEKQEGKEENGHA